MKSIIHTIFQHPAIIQRPVVLVDVGASGEMYSQWKKIAKYSICVSFDADTRDFSVSESSNLGFMKLYRLNRIVSENTSGANDFYLTRSPYCSSSLAPNSVSLSHWAFFRLFDVTQKVAIPTIDLKTALDYIGCDYIDWFKTDSQGTDLRIFNSLPASTIESILIAEFEPGIINAYIGEDKLHHLLAYMEKKPFWICGMDIFGSQRIDSEDLSSLNWVQRRRLSSFLKSAPGWCEISFVNDFASETFGIRELLLGWTFSTIKGEHGFSLKIAKLGFARFQDSIFLQLQKYSRSALSTGYLSLLLKLAHEVGQRILEFFK